MTMNMCSQYLNKSMILRRGEHVRPRHSVLSITQQQHVVQLTAWIVSRLKRTYFLWIIREIEYVNLIS